MADPNVKISALNVALSIAGSDVLPAVSGGDTVQITRDNLISNLTNPTLPQQPATKAYTDAQIAAKQTNRYFGASVDGGGSNITNGFLGYYTVGFSGTITGWSTTAKGTNPTCTYDIWKIATGPNVPTANQTITGGSGNRPALVTGNALRSTNMTNWTVNFTAGDIFGFNLDTTANATWAQILLEAVS